ncbi:TorD/DmsD family molecular chaperone [Sedimenticola sp.]|uniref:TorD/DmsD family molecular chaperone n=1 Tax=Sedimenticola sp. TaxID=1940285 RepID=UPI00258AB444|nr:molecular chaperone TorD family protein [Sedimenticola sp.]MCW8902293.1 molecular chaperone TorD family protein [Sedimenticola sp.]
MANQVEAMRTELLEQQSQTNTATISAGDSEQSPEQHYRAGAYGLLASLLSRPPDQERLDWVSGFAPVEQTGDEMALAMSMLGLAATTCRPEAIDDEYHALFIGLGRGELVPYGSWYLTGFLMERPLGRLRDDLAALGFERDPGVHEPEDHAAALCEVMQLLISDAVPHNRQADFFNTHMADWCKRFFIDLSEARSAVFYRAVGRFGIAFMEVERRYLSMQV